MACSDLVACMASLSVQVTNEVALAGRGAHGEGATGPGLTIATIPASLFNSLIHSASDGQAIWTGIRHLSTLALIVQCIICIWTLRGVIAGASTTSHVAVSFGDPQGQKNKKERRRRIIDNSDEEEETS